MSTIESTNGESKMKAISSGVVIIAFILSTVLNIYGYVQNSDSQHNLEVTSVIRQEIDNVKALSDVKYFEKSKGVALEVQYNEITKKLDGISTQQQKLLDQLITIERRLK